MTSRTHLGYHSKKHTNRRFIRLGYVVSAMLIIGGLATYQYALWPNGNYMMHSEPSSRNPVAADNTATTPYTSGLNEQQLPLQEEAVTGAADNHETNNKQQQPAQEPVCSSGNHHLVKDYSRQADKNLKSLNNRLAYPLVGSSISIQYIKTYNQQAEDLYRQYQQKADAADCELDIPAPLPLPDSYPQ